MLRKHGLASGTQTPDRLSKTTDVSLATSSVVLAREDEPMLGLRRLLRNQGGLHAAWPIAHVYVRRA